MAVQSLVSPATASPVVETFDTPVQLMASRHPELFRDLSDWVRLHPSSTKLTGAALTPLMFSVCSREVLLNAVRPALALEVLAGLGARCELLHMFPTASAMLQFLTQPNAALCIEDSRWVPLLLLPAANAAHLQTWFSRVPLHEWPWVLNDRQNDPDPSIAHASKALGEIMVQMAQHRTAVLMQTLQSQYKDRPTPAHILREGKRRLRVMVLAASTSVYQQFCARDITDGLLAAGVEVQCYIPAPGAQSSYETVDRVRDFDPDVMLLNGNGRMAMQFPPELCICSWDQDYALSPSEPFARKMGPRDLLMLMVADWQTDAAQNNIPARRTRHLNLGSNPRIYYPATGQREMEFDVLFVGNIHTFDSYRKLIGFDSLEPTLQRLMLLARARLKTWVLNRGEDEPFVLPEDLEGFLRATGESANLTLTADERQWRFTTHYFRYRIAHLTLRELYIESLREYQLGLFGRGWEAFPTLAAYARPAIENGPPLREAIHRSAINLHLHTWTVHHPRLYDTAAAGGFLLVGRVHEQYPLNEVFQSAGDAKEMDTFGSIKQLKKQIEHYLNHPQERVEIAARAVTRALSDHSMDARMKQAINFMGEDVYDRA